MFADFNDTAIAALDLEPIKIKLMHRSGESWPQEHADAIELEYRRFLFLMKKYPDEVTAPMVDVDTFWHYHILDTMKYAADCECVFGYFLHHFQYYGMRGEEDFAALEVAGNRMNDLYEQTFGVVQFAAASTAEAAFCIKASANGHRQVADGKQSAFCIKAPQAAFCIRAPQAAFCIKIQNTDADQVFARPASSTREQSARQDFAFCIRSPLQPNGVYTAGSHPTAASAM